MTPPNSHSVPRIAIIGGGPGGLMAAYLLEQRSNRPVDLTLFEATLRLGGKILTPRFTKLPVPYEAGAAEFYDYSSVDDDPLKRLILDLGLSVSPMGGNSVLINGKFIGNLDDLENVLGPDARSSFEKFHWAARDAISSAEFCAYAGPESPPAIAYLPGDIRELAVEPVLTHFGLATGARPDSRGTATRFDAVLRTVGESSVRKYIERMIHSDLATEPEKTTIAYGLQNYLMNDPAYMALYGIDGGNEQLPQRLAARLNANVRLGHRVEEVTSLTDGRFRLQLSSNVDNSPPATTAEPWTSSEEFDLVIVALPHDAVKQVRYSGRDLPAAIERHWQYYNYPAHYLRVTLLFRKPFWQSILVDSYTMLDSLEGCCLYDESSRVPEPEYGILGWLLAGKSALEHASLSDDELIQVALQSLPPQLSMAGDYLLEGRVHRWLGAVNAIPGGLVPLPLDVRHQPDPVTSPNLFVIGDYLFDSTINGVLDSADYVSQWISNLLSERA